MIFQLIFAFLKWRYLNNRRKLRNKVYDYFNAERMAHYNSKRRTLDEKSRTWHTIERFGKLWRDDHVWMN